MEASLYETFREISEEPSQGEVRSILWRIIRTSDHFTLMKFTTNWRASFDTPHSREESQKMAGAKTVEEAVIRAILEEKEIDYETRNKIRGLLEWFANPNYFLEPLDRGEPA